MNATGTPDILSLARQARDIAAANRDLSRTATEMATGEKQDVVAATGGDPARLYAIERDISRADARATALTLADARATAAQSALGSIQIFASELGADLAASSGRRDLGASERFAGGARDAFEGVVAALNTRVGDRSLFAGADAAGPAIAEASVILDEIATRVAGAATAADVIAAVEDYFFTDPAGFDATGYLGSLNDAPEVEIGDGVRIQAAQRADDDAFRRTMSALALSVVAVEGAAPALGNGARLDIFGESALQALAANEQVIGARAALGDAEARIETAIVANSAESAFLAAGRSAIVSRDPFEAASEFTALETRLQSVFAVTARLSSLTLTNFLR